MKRWILVLLMSCLGLSLQCGDPLADGEYRGQSLLHLEGGISIPNETISAEAPLTIEKLKLAVFWSTAGIEGTFQNPVTSVEQQAVTTTVFPGRFTMDLFSPPPDIAIRPVVDGTGQFALGLLLVYMDVDNNGAWDFNQDFLMGGGVQVAIVYTPGGMSSDEFGEHAPGYHTLRLSSPTDICGNDETVEWTKSEGDQLNIAITFEATKEMLIDLDCNGKYDDWDAVCTPPDELPPEVLEECPVDMCDDVETLCPLSWCCGTSPYWQFTNDRHNEPLPEPDIPVSDEGSSSEDEPPAPEPEGEEPPP